MMKSHYPAAPSALGATPSPMVGGFMLKLSPKLFGATSTVQQQQRPATVVAPSNDEDDFLPTLDVPTQAQAPVASVVAPATTNAPPAYDFDVRSPPVSRDGVHHVYGGTIIQKFGYHHAFGEDEENFAFIPCSTPKDRRDCDELVRKWIVPGNKRPEGGEGIFCGQITAKDTLYAIAVMASMLEIPVYCYTPKFKPVEQGRIRGHVEFWVPRGEAVRFVSNSKGLVCCDHGGFWVPRTQEGSDLMKQHSLHVPPVQVGVPQWPVTLEHRQAPTHGHHQRGGSYRNQQQGRHF